MCHNESTGFHLLTEIGQSEVYRLQHEVDGEFSGGDLPSEVVQSLSEGPGTGRWDVVATGRVQVLGPVDDGEDDEHGRLVGSDVHL